LVEALGNPGPNALVMIGIVHKAAYISNVYNLRHREYHNDK